MSKDDSNGFGTVRRPNNDTRIRYVEPNDIYGDINGVPITPDYTDYCIWCNLIVEKFSRIKNGSSGTSESSNSKTYVYSWDATRADGTHWVSFMTGRQDGPDYNYMTTDYTEIDFNEVKDRNFIEGLGIESVTITMNNYYVPEITINFVDVRGSGFFGREEATHDTFDLINLERDKYGNLTDNFYSCFVSFPYPRFKLQVKGFYGRPVTYQLTCSSFTGSLDSSTGNFKLTAKFIGYFYGIMADIPFEYLVAAPLCTYVGQSYWDDNVNKPEWRLDDDRPPIKLYDFYNLVSNAMQSTDGRVKLMGTVTNDAMEHCKMMSTKLRAVRGMVGEFKTELKREFEDASFECNTVDSGQLILLGKTDTVKLSDRVCGRYNKLVTILDEYTREYGSSYKTEKGETLDKSKRPGTQEDKWVSGETKLTEFFRVSGGKLYCGSKDLSNARTSLKGLILPTCSPSNGDGLKTTVLSEDISDVVKKSAGQYQKIITSGSLYACAIDFNRIEYTITDIESKVNRELEKLENELSERQTQNIIDYFGFAPYVGNFFKIVMCHLETFVEIMYSVANVIDGQMASHDREAGKLGININDTDLSSKLADNIPPWPAVFEKKKPNRPDDSMDVDSTTRYDTFGDDSDTRGWVGDTMGVVDWEERSMLMAFYNALTKVIAPKKADGTDLSATNPTVSANVFPSIPSDLYTGVPKYATESKQKLAAYLGIRLMQVYALYNRGNVSERYAKAFAILDAYNFFKQTDSKAVKTMITPSKGTSIGDELYRLMLAPETGSGTHCTYEFTNVVNDRHPIYVENGSSLTYSYMKTKNGMPILPVTVDNLTSGQVGKYFDNNGGGNFTPKYDSENQFSQLGNGFQYSGTTKKMLDNYAEPERSEIKADYQNPSLFYMAFDEEAELLDTYSDMFATGDFVTDSSDMDEILKDNKKLFSEFSSKYWKTMDKDDYLYDGIGTMATFDLAQLDSINSKNIKTRLGKRKAGL